MKLRELILTILFSIIFNNILLCQSEDTLIYRGKIAYEDSSIFCLLNFYKGDNAVYNDDGFYFYEDSSINYLDGFLCLTSFRFNPPYYDRSKSMTDASNFYFLLNFSEIKAEGIIKSYINNTNNEKLLKKLKSRQLKKINFPIPSHYHNEPDFVKMDRLKICYEILDAEITAIREKKYDFKRYVFDGKKLKLIKIPFYYIVKLDIDGHIIR